MSLQSGKRLRSRTSSDCGASPDSPTSYKKLRWQDGSGTDEPENDSEDERETESEKTYLAVLCSHGRLGCAYYDVSKSKIYVLEDTQDTNPYDLTKLLLEQACPDMVLTSSRADDEFIDALREYAEPSVIQVQIRPYKEFSFAKGRERLLSLNRLFEYPENIGFQMSPGINPVTPCRNGNTYDSMFTQKQINIDPATKRWNASIRLSNFLSLDSSPLCVASVGALIDHLVRERALGDFDDEGIDGLDIRDIEVLALNTVMQINSDALLSLQIFENESHASVHSLKTKEGLSLFGILNNTKTSLGRSLLRTWLLRPSLLIDVIHARHEAVACFIAPENIEPTTILHNHLKGIKNLPKILQNMKVGRTNISCWQGIVKFTYHTTMLRDTLNDLHQADNVTIVQKLIKVLDVTTFKEVGTRVNEIIDWEESNDSGRVCVRPLVNEELDNRKLVYQGIDIILCKVAEQISGYVPRQFASSLNVVYFPQLGYLICVPMLEEWQTETGIQVLDGWTFQFSSDAHVYFKSQEMHDMDLHIGDLHSTIVDREIEIIQELLEDILVHYTAISHACDVFAELDCLLCFAEVSRLHCYTRPNMVTENVVHITQGRHPLQEQVVDTFVPNDAHIVGGRGTREEGEGDGCNSILLCTGANACGKSVYLKQIAMIQFMAQIGCFVPAECATLGLVDKIFTRVSTRESVSKAQSAFMIDLNQVSLSLRNCTARSLILLDEFGKGTLPTDGAGLFCGVIKHFLNRGTDCPKVLVATHFHDVFTKDLLDPDLSSISFCNMQVIFITSDGMILEDEQDGDSSSVTEGVNKIAPGEKIVYLYRVAQGLSLESHAAKCAAMFGIPPQIVERANYVSQLVSSHELGRLLDEEMSEEDKADLQNAEAVCRRFLEWKLDAEESVDVKTKLAQVLGMDPT